MKRFLAIATALLALSASAYAQGMMKGGEYAKTELDAVRSELGTRLFGELTINELTPFYARIKAAAQKDLYVSRAAAMSMHFPGTGQVKNGDTLQGIGFITLHAATVAGTLAGWYFLLPPDLRFDALDYSTASKESVRTAWHAHSLQEYLPSAGVLAAGLLVDGGIRMWSAITARNGAKAAVESGTAKLTPMAGPGFFGMRMRF